MQMSFVSCRHAVQLVDRINPCAHAMTSQVALSLQSFVFGQRGNRKVCSRRNEGVKLHSWHPYVRSASEVAGRFRHHHKPLSCCSRHYAMASQQNVAADFASLQQVALQAAETGAQVVQEALDKPRNIHFKGVTDLVTDTDRASEEAVLKVLRAQVPDHGFLGEEGGVSGNAESDYLWCIDPIDGTTNFAAGYPAFAVSIAVLHKAIPVAAAVVEFAGGPTAWVTRTYTASQGGGAQCSGKALKVTSTSDVTQSLLVTGFGYEHDEAWAANMELFKELTDVSRGVRRLGAAAVDLCHVALGVSDGYWEYRLKPWDCAAGVLMVQEAGGTVTTMTGDPYTVFHRSVLASAPGLHKGLLEHTKPKTEALINKGIELGTWYVPQVYEQYTT